MPIAGQVQIEEVLRPSFFPQNLNFCFRIPLARSCPSRAHFGLDLDAVVVPLRDPPANRAIMLVAIASFGKDSCAAFEVTGLRAEISTSNISFDDKLTNEIRISPKRDVGKYLVVFFQLFFTILVGNYSPVLA